MNTVQLTEVLDLPVEERAQGVWDSVSDSPGPYPLSDQEREELNRRLEAYRLDPEAVSRWPEVKQRILRRAFGGRVVS